MDTDNKRNMSSKKIVLFLLSQNLSLFGSSVVGFAIIWYITLETSSGFWVMLSTICSMIPQVIISLWSGVWADRYNRKHLIMYADAFIALSTFILAIVFIMGYQSIVLILVVSIVRSLGAGVQTPAVSAIYTQIVPREKLTKIQGLNQALSSVLMLVAPAVGGVMLGSLGIEWAFFMDVITAALAIFIISFIKVDKIERTDELKPVFVELLQGIKYTFSNSILAKAMICYAFTFFLITPVAFFTPLMIERSFGSEVWKLTANEILWTVGTLAGGIFVSIYGEFKDKVKTISICLVAFGVSSGLLGLSWNFVIYLIIMGASGFFMPVIATAQTVLIQETSEPAMLGRVFSIIQIIASSVMPVATLLFGPAADVVDVEILLIITGVLLTLVGIFYQLSNRREKIKRAEGA